MKDVPLTVVAVIQAKEGKESEVKEALTGLIEPTRAESGCLQYELHVDEQNPGRFVFYENWTDKAALDAHLASEHLQNMGRITKDLLAAPVELTLCRKIA